MTLSEFRTWALNEGQVAKYDDGQFLGQCVSLINQYCYRVLDVPAGAWGHAYAWANDNNPNRAYFDKVNTIDVGDVLVYGTNFTPEFGHIVIATGAGQLLDQNGRKPLRVAIGPIYNGYIAILRRKVTQGEPMATFATPEEVNSLYQTYAGYTPTVESLGYWTARPTENLVDSLMTSPETKAYQDKIKAALAGESSGYKKITDLYIKE